MGLQVTESNMGGPYLLESSAGRWITIFAFCFASLCPSLRILSVLLYEFQSWDCLLNFLSFVISLRCLVNY